MISHAHTSESRTHVDIQEILDRAKEDQIFDEPAIRRRFIRIVFFLLMVQLLCTFGIVCVFVFVEVVHNFICEYRLPFYISMGLMFPLYVGLAYLPVFRRRVPLNYITLTLFTILKSICIAYITTVAEPMKVLIALGITTAMVGILSTFAMQVRYDFTVCNITVFVTSTLMFGLGIVAIFVRNWVFFIALSCLGVLAASLYLVYDLQLMMGGRHKYALLDHEYTFAAFNLYTDILLMFTQLLNLVECND